VFDWLAKESAVIYRRFYPDLDLKLLTKTGLDAIQKAAKHYRLNRDYSFAVYAMWAILAAFGVPVDQIEGVRSLMEENVEVI